jgi:hypothetical protein
MQAAQQRLDACLACESARPPSGGLFHGLQFLRDGIVISMSLYRVLVIGGYGFFGSRLVARLAQQPHLHVIVCGRSEASAHALVKRLSHSAQARLESWAADVDQPTFEQALITLGPNVVVHASGPFQGQDYRVAAACIQARSHYIDLADGRSFVEGIGAFNAAAESAGLLVTSGASSVPALSSAVSDALVEGLTSVQAIDIGISPGNRTDRGLSTIKAILSYCGKALPTSSSASTVIGWRDTYAYDYPVPVGRRLLSPCDVPDLVLLGARYASHPAVRFGAGLELRFLHRGMNILAWLSQSGLVHNWANHAGALMWVANWFKRWGSDAGAMHVCVTGQDKTSQVVTRRWHLVATHGDGPFVPTLAAAALVRKLAAGEMPDAGARPCMGLLTLQDFLHEAQGLHITMEVGL